MWRKVWIFKRKRGRQTSYALRWYNERGRVKTETVGTDKKLAEALRKRKEHELNSGITKEVQNISFEAFCEEHLRLMQGRMAPRSILDIQMTLELFDKICHPRRLEDISPKMVEEFVAARIKKVKPATVNKDIRTLKAIFNHAIRRGYLIKNPFSEVGKLPVPEKEIRVLTVPEIEALLDACPNKEWKAFVYLALVTGLRKSELCHLRWEDVDFEKGVLKVINREDFTTKSRRNRILGLPPSSIDMLRNLYVSRNGSHYVFLTKVGTPWKHNLNKHFDQIVKKAGIKRCTIHDLRRTFVSHLAMAGENEAVVQALAGHSSIGTTLKYYTNIFPQSLLKASSRLPYADLSEQKSYQNRITRLIRQN